MDKVAIAADFHFGVSGRLHDCLWSARVLREYCRKANIEVVIILGDLFHDRRTLEIDVITSVCEFFTETADQYGQKWIAFPGNHDMFLRYSWKINSLGFMKRYLTAVCDVKLMEIGPRRFWILPFIAFEQSYMKAFAAISQQAERGDVLLTHIGVRSATLNTCFLRRDWSVVDMTDNKFAKVYSGHFHNYQQVHGNLWYPGSPIPFKVDEGDVPHGFIVLDLKTLDQKFIDIWRAGTALLTDEPQPPQFRTLLDDQLGDLNAADVANNVVRICLTQRHDETAQAGFRQQVLDLGARSVKIVNWEKTFKSGPDENRMETLTRQGLIHEDLFEAWMETDTNGIKQLDRKLLTSLNHEVVKEGDELYAAQAEDELLD